ncbi:MULTISPECIES: beta-ketoacyl-[acyl-carrier-protein] synthase family protein [unclassified Burkholderia]|uniref:beta-ketoacyl-[acyl-carrier-protein] synthase family protein n=1 Tax=unclassified Burkholderia TaxID=2613784 RepID=UPI00142347A9|nr:MULTISPECIES: beta-ketoacyl-[acyl-carrier-protein] synthase family protein [unclassified Burkholderia]NIE57316.1 beta-ketoacyl-[acyl-carrier-protein] synthase family protein [Burkholderia sp. Ap-955]NIF08042.1 beta-ketoacyl-[acyl-carrier-protein] synthase family protein [Burkholderia sp. Ax-1735]NIG02046.1 beta-ketoacyl-[acyl-carrier-protein] synthase family protein [Burkholderia sp. Tr-849]
MQPFSATITGLGLVTSAGTDVAANWQRVLSGAATATTDAALDDLPVRISCRVPGFESMDLGLAHPWQWDRFSQFALLAAREAVRDAGLEPGQWEDSSRVAVIIGSGAGGTLTLEAQHAVLLNEGADDISSLTLPMGLLNMAAGQVAIALGARGPCFAPCSACASGASAIGLGKELLRSGAADIVIAGGSEAPITRFYVSAFARMRALSRNPDAGTASRPFDAARDGFVIGEGAGIVVLESDEHALRRGARARARLLGYGASADAHHVTSPHPQGLGATLAMQAALRDAGIDASMVGYVNAHGTSTPGNDVVEATAIRELFGARVPVSSTKGVTGHLLGAAGAVEAVYAALAASQGYAPPTANLRNPDPRIDLNLVVGEPRRLDTPVALSNSFGFGGQNVSLVIGA